jgi:hypothetical protein
MPRNLVLSSEAPGQGQGRAQGQAPAPPGGRAGGRGFGPTLKPSALRAVSAESTVATVKDPNWKAPRAAWGHPDSGAPIEGRQPVRGLGGGR